MRWANCGGKLTRQPARGRPRPAARLGCAGALKAIAERGRAAELDCLDTQVECELLRECWRAFGTDRFDLLPDEGLEQIARAALDAFDRPAGRHAPIATP